MSALRALAPRLPRAAWVLLGGDALSALGTGLTLPFFLVYLHDVRGIDLELAALALSMIAVAGLVGNLVGGWLSDRCGARRALMLGLLVNAAGALSIVAVREAWHALAAAALLGLGAAVVWPAGDALLSTVGTPDQRSTIFSVRHLVLNAGFGCGGLAAALVLAVAPPFGFELLYVLDALSFLAFAFVLGRLDHIGKPAGTHARTASGASYREVLADRMFLRIWALVALLVTIGYAQYHAAFPAFATGGGRLSASGLAVAFAANTFTVVAVQLVALRIASGRRRTRALAVVCAFWAGAWALTLLGGSLTGGVAAVAAFAGAMVLLGVGETLIAPTVPALVNDLAPEHLRGRYNGAYTLAWTTGFMVGPALAGVALGAGQGRTLLLGLIAACGIAAVSALRLERRLPAGLNVVPAVRPAGEVAPAAA